MDSNFNIIYSLEQDDLKSQSDTESSSTASKS